MTTARRAIAAALAALWGAVRPEPGTTEGAVTVGLAMVSLGLLVAGLPALALIVPGTALAALGSLPAIRRR